MTRRITDQINPNLEAQWEDTPGALDPKFKLTASFPLWTNDVTLDLKQEDLIRLRNSINSALSGYDKLQRIDPQRG